MADKNWSSDEIREGLRRLADIDVAEEVERARSEGGPLSLTTYRDFLEEAKDVAMSVFGTSWDTSPRESQAQARTGG